jgi:hypothetical protein
MSLPSADWLEGSTRCSTSSRTLGDIVDLPALLAGHGERANMAVDVLPKVAVGMHAPSLALRRSRVRKR